MGARNFRTSPKRDKHLLKGVTVSPGVAVGPVRFAGYELDQPTGGRIPSEHVEAEVERFQRAVESSKEQLRALGDKLEEDLGKDELRILAVHVAYLEDPIFLGDVESKIREDQLPVEGALRRVVQDFDRIFELVETKMLKEKAHDLRDVALRVVRNVEESAALAEPIVSSEPHILLVRKLGLSDLFGMDHEQVLGIVAEEGGANSHAAILARSMQIPTLTGIPDLRSRLRTGDMVILDARTGVLHRNPPERLQREFEVRMGESGGVTVFDQTGPAELADGKSVHLYGSCGNLGEVEQSRDAGLDGIGLYRTEVLYLAHSNLPSEELLQHHYAEVLARAGEGRVIFRLLDIAPDFRLAGLPHRNEPNPALGLRGLRWLFHYPSVFREQLRALLRQDSGGTVDIALPTVTTIQDIQRVRAAVREERAALLKQGQSVVDEIRIGVIIEVPAVAFHLAGVAVEADFLIVALDGLQQYLLCADRDNLAVADYSRIYHPSLFRLLVQVAKDARLLGKEIMLYGEAASDPLRLPFYVGAGFDKICVSAVRSAQVRHLLSRWRAVDAEALTRRVIKASTSLGLQKILLEAEH